MVRIHRLGGGGVVDIIKEMVEVDVNLMLRP